MSTVPELLAKANKEEEGSGSAGINNPENLHSHLFPPSFRPFFHALSIGPAAPRLSGNIPSMKFGQYLEQNLTPEWRRAYIDYKGCKKRIRIVEDRLKSKGSPGTAAAAIERQRTIERDERDSSGDDADNGPAARPKGSSSRNTPKLRSTQTNGKSPSNKPNSGSSSLSPRPDRPSSPIPPPLDIGEPSVGPSSSRPTRSRGNSVAFAPGSNGKNGAGPSFSKSPDEMGLGAEEEVEFERTRQRVHSGISEGSTGSGSADPSTPLISAGNGSRTPKSPKFSLRGAAGKISATASPVLSGVRPVARTIRTMSISSPSIPVRSADTFRELYKTLEPDEKAFFDYLESELQKVESFYLARQEEAITRGKDLKIQLHELSEHRKLYHEFYPGSLSKWESTVERYLPGMGSAAAHATVTSMANAAQKLQQRLPHGAGSYGEQQGGEDRIKTGEVESQVGAVRRSDHNERDKKQFSADRYTKYKHELRKATLEYYRHLEIIKNYRILNVTGFRKALKKFEKVTKVHCLETFTEECISAEAFAKGETIEGMLKDTENMFTEHFEHGNSKKARDRLRKQDYVNTHYTSVFRSGLMMGVGLPTMIISIVQAMHIRDATPGDVWNGLLQVYGGLFIPVIFCLLIELNLDAFVSARINYEFVMELSRPVIDFRSYMEIPSFLFLTLSVCMYFSFFSIGSLSVAPTTWPAAWLVFVIVFFINPLPILRRRTRYWFLRVIWRVFTPGFSRVEFIAFFVADELNSLAYSMSNLLFIGCAYANKWPSNLYSVCHPTARWPYIFMLAAPAAIRFIQCIKRYHDSSLKIHLINAGKYVTVVAQYTMYVMWRSRGSGTFDPTFIAWCIVAVIYSSYTSAWDIIVDWSLLRPGTQGLRKDRGYRSKWIYYFAIVTNIIIRFSWVWYIPNRGANTRLRGFIFAVAEMFRRWQWNFYRVETEHLGNADAYRVTREIPLPYRRLDPDSEEEAELAAEDNGVGERWNKLKRKFVKPNPEGRGPNQLDVGPRGHRGQREYEARRPGDSDQDSQEPEDESEIRGWEGLLRRIKKQKKAQGEDGFGAEAAEAARQV